MDKYMYIMLINEYTKGGQIRADSKYQTVLGYEYPESTYLPIYVSGINQLYLWIYTYLPT